MTDVNITNGNAADIEARVTELETRVALLTSDPGDGNYSERHYRWALDELAEHVGLNGSSSPFMIVDSAIAEMRHADELIAEAVEMIDEIRSYDDGVARILAHAVQSDEIHSARLMAFNASGLIQRQRTQIVELTNSVAESQVENLKLRNSIDELTDRVRFFSETAQSLRDEIDLRVEVEVR